MKRRVKKNVWGNWKGYFGRTYVADLGVDDVVAGYWLETGITSLLAGYADADKYRKLANEGVQK